jgi:glucose-6-phosphate isomerase
MKRYVFQLRISADQYLDYYRGTVRHVIARSTNGENVQFPAALLQQFVTTEGIQGRFALTCDDALGNSRLERLE